MKKKGNMFIFLHQTVLQNTGWNLWLNWLRITNITSHGFWVIINDREYFISFHDYPEFKKASVDSIFNMTILSPGQLQWLDIDIDIELDALNDPDKFPLQFKG